MMRRMGIDLLLEHFSEPLAQPKQAKPAAAKKPEPYQHLHRLTDTALRSRLKSDSGSTAGERQAAAALIQRRRDESDRVAARTAAKQEKQQAAPPAADKPAEKAQEASIVGLLTEAFSGALPKPGTAAASPTAVAADPTVALGWDPSKHPRNGGKFTTTTGGKGARTSTRGNFSDSVLKGTPNGAMPKTLGTGSSGPLVQSLQRQLGVTTTGKYDPATTAAVEQFQKQHGLQVDGVIGHQTLAALRGNPNAAKLAPGDIRSGQARIRNAKPSRPLGRYTGGAVV
jgi:hypothetical protein